MKINKVEFDSKNRVPFHITFLFLTEEYFQIFGIELKFVSNYLKKWMDEQDIFWRIIDSEGNVVDKFRFHNGKIHRPSMSVPPNE